MAKLQFETSLNIEDIQKRAAALRPALFALKAPNSLAFELNIVTQLLLHSSNFKVRKWVKEKLQHLRDIELVRNLSFVEAGDLLFFANQISDGMDQVKKIETGYYKDLMKTFKEKQESNFQTEADLLAEIEKIKNLKDEKQQLLQDLEEITAEVEVLSEDKEMMDHFKTAAQLIKASEDMK